MGDLGKNMFKTADNMRRIVKRGYQSTRDFLKESARADSREKLAADPKIDSVQKAEDALAKLQEYKTRGRPPVTLDKNELENLKKKLTKEEIDEFLKLDDNGRKKHLGTLKTEMSKKMKERKKQINEAMNKKEENDAISIGRTKSMEMNKMRDKIKYKEKLPDLAEERSDLISQITGLMKEKKKAETLQLDVTSIEGNKKISKEIGYLIEKRRKSLNLRGNRLKEINEALGRKDADVDEITQGSEEHKETIVISDD